MDEETIIKWCQKTKELPLKTIFRNMEIVGYQHSNGKILLVPENDQEIYIMHNIRYKIYCHSCGTSKIVDHRNLIKMTSCGCKHPMLGKNFNWTGKSDKI